MSLNVDALIRDIEIAFTRLSSSKDASVSSKFTDNPPKSTDKAKSLTKTGTGFFLEKKFEDALSWYTKSIAYALDGSEELITAYNDRAAALFILRQYKSCLLDINRALKYHCSDVSRRNKLLNIKIRFLSLLKNSADVSGDMGDEIDEDATNPPADREPSWRTDVFNQFGNPFIPNASPKIKLEYDEKWGRHFVATADIQAGETLLIENYFATLLFSDDGRRYKYCDFCISPCDSLIPCVSCVKVMYCSIECRQNAYDSYHRLECKLSIFFPSAYNSAAVEIATRMFLIGTQQGASLENLMNTLSITDVFAENFNFSGKPVDSDYLTVLRLTHGAFNQSRLESLVEKAVEFVIVLQKHAFFESVPADRLEKAKIFTVQLLLNNYTDRCMNVLQNSDSKSGEVMRIGVGLCPLQYMFNHSCYPNVGTHRRKREFIVFSTRPIKKDEQLFVTYYNEFLNTPKAERAENLDFMCQCEACLNDLFTITTKLSSRPVSMAITKIVNFLECSADGREVFRVLSSVMHIIVPLLDDTSLLNLPVDEIVRILRDMISLCCQVFGTLSSLTLVYARYCLLKFIRYYYEEMERDPSQHTNFKFPGGNLRAVDDISIRWTDEPTEFIVQAALQIFVALFRLITYIRKSRFIRKK